MGTDRDEGHTSPTTPLRPFRIGTGQPQLVLPDEPSRPEHETGANDDDGDAGDAPPGDPTA